MRSALIRSLACAAAAVALALLSFAPGAEAQSPIPNPSVTPKISAKLNHLEIKRGTSANLTGTVSTYAPGTYADLQGRHGKSWRNVSHVELRLGGEFSFTIRGRSKGKFSYRVSIAASGDFRNASSKTVTLSVS